jgi:Putative adhesin
MKAFRSDARSTRLALLAALALLPGFAAPAVASTRPVAAQQAADPTGTVEIINVAGSIEVTGWNQPQVDVSGTMGDKVDRVEVTGGANHTTVRVVLPSGNSWMGDSSAHLKIKVPHGCALDVSLVSADLAVSGIDGSQKLQTVSGNISGTSAGNLQVSTVSGDVRMTTHDDHALQVKTISGDMIVNGADGDVQVKTVSGDAELTFGSLTRARIESVSGDVKVSSTLAPTGQFEASSVSGDLQVKFSAEPDADIDVQSFSGDISNCFGPKPTEEKYGPGSRLNFRSGKGGGHVHIDTKSGDVSVCNLK